MKRSFLIPLLLGALAAWCGSCIENNLPYPVVELAVLSCEGEGFTAEIDAKTRTVVLRLDETTDISRVGKQGLNLGNVLSLDILANSVKNSFDRPIYFASTVPSSYYLGLTPFMGSTGMAMEVTPFATPSVSPTVDKAYENIMGNIRWGGLDGDNPAGLYLDETVRRMVSSTRSGIFSTARDLINSGEATVKVLDTESKWFGVTYAADRPGVVAKFAELHRDGTYPEKLF